ncbi:hypothetical protein Nmel_001889 [Mimus melanotis]
MACEMRAEVEAVTGMIALAGWRRPPTLGSHGEPALRDPWQGPYPGEALGNLQGRSRPDGSHADLGTAAFSPGGRRGGGASPRAGRGLPGDPGPGPAPLPAPLPRTSFGRHLGRADTVIAPMHAAVPPPPAPAGPRSRDAPSLHRR